MVESRRAAYKRIDRLSKRDYESWPEWMKNPATVRVRTPQSSELNRKQNDSMMDGFHAVARLSARDIENWPSSMQRRPMSRANRTPRVSPK